MKIIIMAQGRGSRWHVNMAKRIALIGEVPPFKQLIPIGNTTIIGRTIRMLVARGIEETAILVVAPQAFEAKVGGAQLLTLAGDAGPLVEGMKRLRSRWGPDSTLWLFGDTVYSAKALDMILGMDTDLGFVGRVGAGNSVTQKGASELFGFRMNSSMYDPIYEAVVELSDRARQREGLPGRLWELMEWMDQQEIDWGEVAYPGDFTDDVDSVEEYKARWEALSRAALAEDGE